MNDNAIFDIQIKRLHEYKRQQMNVLYIIYKYLDIKAGNKPKRPITMIFGAKGTTPGSTIHYCKRHHSCNPVSAGTDQERSGSVTISAGCNGRELQRNNGRKTDSCM